jgi:hypothetical protein
MTAAGDILFALRSIGATIEAAGDQLVLRAGSQPVPAGIIRRAREAKPELLALLCQEAVPAEGAQISRRCSLSKVSAFGKSERLRDESSLGRVAPTVDGEPGLEQPSLARRGRVVVLDKGVILHFCVKCGRFGAFGYGVRLRAGHPGRWYCGEHRPRGVDPLKPSSGQRGKLTP